MKKIVVFAALVFAANLTMAGANNGSKVQASNPLYDETGTIVGTVVPVPDACEVVIPQSGKAVYIMCEESDY